MQYFAFLAAFLPSALAATYPLTDTFVGNQFLSGFQWQAIGDPTHGRVNYVDQPTALAQNLTYANGNTLVLRADSKTTLTPAGPGRNSVRIMSNKSYTTHVVVLDTRHMPQGCGTWPAFWETGPNWPYGGEVDIIEGVNDQSPNAMTLHTATGCTMPASRGPMTGTAGNNDCQWYNGCGVSATGSSNSYGPPFNNNGGGWYAMERNNDFIKVWFWPRNGSPPADVRNGANSVNTDNWGTPVAFFPSTQCPMAEYFGANQIIINLTFCGDWAGQAAVWAASGCPTDCVTYVNNNPSAYVNAYWDIASLHVYSSPNVGIPLPTGPAHQLHPGTGAYPTKCIDVQNAIFAAGTPVQIWDCNGTPAQNWLINPGQTAIQLANTNFCIDAGSAPADGAKLHIQPCNTALPSQNWYVTNDNHILLANMGFCFDDTEGSVVDGNPAQIWTCTANDVYQTWTIQ